MVGRRLLLAFILISCSLFVIGAAQNPVVEMNLISLTAYQLDSQDLMQGMGMDLKVSLPSENSGNVRGEVALRTTYNSLVPTPIASVDDIIYNLKSPHYYSIQPRPFQTNAIPFSHLSEGHAQRLHRSLFAVWSEP
ncbi:hypothetical protein DSECCO2_611680 [anaerobic digester metagenome]